jgi:uncharacterized protein (TIGR02996 family)
MFRGAETPFGGPRVGEDQAFLEAIRANPKDESLKLVYADWLEERGDPRAEFLRLQHQLQTLPLRLATLCWQFDPYWLHTVRSGNGSDVPELRGILRALSWINTVSDLEYNLTLDEIPKPGPLIEALQRWYARFSSVRSVTPIDEQQLRELLRHWVVPPSQRHEFILDEVWFRLIALTTPPVIWRVDTTPMYDVIQEEIAIEGSDRVYVLHLGGSD